MPDITLHPKILRGRVPLPAVGDRIYVPTRPSPLLIGGLAHVSVVQRIGAIDSTLIGVEEHPDIAYVWGEIRSRQVSLWNEFNATAARMPNAEELTAVVAEAERMEAFKREQERKASEPRRFACAGGGLIEVPVWEKHPRSKNWAAIVTVDPLAPGGLFRWWFNRSMGGPALYIVPPELKEGAVVEFGADYIRGSGFRTPERWYGIVTEIAPTYLAIEPCKDVKTAVLRSLDRLAKKDMQPQP